MNARYDGGMHRTVQARYDAGALDEIAARPLFTVTDICQLLNVERDTVYRWIRSVDLPSSRRGAFGHFHVTGPALADFLKARMGDAP